MSKQTIKLKLVRSPIGYAPKHRLCVRGLGLRRMHQQVEVEDTPAVRGMLRKVNYMVQEVQASQSKQGKPNKQKEQTR